MFLTPVNVLFRAPTFSNNNDEVHEQISFSRLFFRLNLSVAFTTSFGHKSAEDIHLYGTFKVLRQVSRTFSKSWCFGNVPRYSRKSNFDDVFCCVLLKKATSTSGPQIYFYRSLLESEKVGP